MTPEDFRLRVNLAIEKISSIPKRPTLKINEKVGRTSPAKPGSSKGFKAYKILKAKKNTKSTRSSKDAFEIRVAG